MKFLESCRLFFIVANLCCVSLGVRKNADYEKVKYQYETEIWLEKVNADLSRFNELSALVTWELSTGAPQKVAEQAKMLAKVRNIWKNKVCESQLRKDWLTEEQQRNIYLLCRGPKFTNELLVKFLTNNALMAKEYNSEICLGDFPKNINVSKVCLYGEPDLENLIKRDLEPGDLKWIWMKWHNFVGPKLKNLYQKSVLYQNTAAHNNGYRNMGEVWREELEIPNLEEVVFDLYEEVKPLYKLLHAVVRHKLYQKYGPEFVDVKGPIPIHLLRNMWGQDWSSLTDLFFPPEYLVDLDKNLKKKQWEVEDLVVQAEDYYVSLGLPKMTKKFWQHSIFEESENTSVCHGSAANLYSKDDFRMILCAQVNMEYFYVIHHEMGHIEYYMAYQDQPAVFQEGTNSAFHESIGDAIMNGVMTEQHLNRLGILPDDALKEPNTKWYLLLKQALTKIPEIPFALLIDKFRWDVFKNKIRPEDYNEAYWRLNLEMRGIVPPEKRNESYFDIGGKFHVPDNTPYIRYFLGTFMQAELFKSFCETLIFGSTTTDENGSDEKYFPLHQCDIYGAKEVGKKLMSVMEKGASIRWSEAMKMLTGKDYLSTEAFFDYYRPVYEFLQKYVDDNNIYVGW